MQNRLARPTRRQIFRAVPAIAAALATGRAARADTAVLRVGDQKGGARSVMQAAGVLDDVPYRIEWSQFPAAAPVLEALNAGAVDVAVAGDAPATFALSAGLPGRIISAIRTTGAGTAIMVPKDSAIRAVADLKGKAIATNRGSIGHALLLALSESQTWSKSDTRMVNLLPGEAKTALAAGSVDAWSSWGVYVAQGTLVDGARVVVDGTKGMLTNLSYLVARDDAIGRRREALLDYCRRLAAARRWATAHPAAYAPVLAAEIGVTEAVARRTFDNDLPVPVAIDAAVIADEQIVADRYLAAGIIRSHLDAATCFDASFNQALAG